MHTTTRKRSRQPEVNSLRNGTLELLKLSRHIVAQQGLEWLAVEVRRIALASSGSQQLVDAPPVLSLLQRAYTAAATPIPSGCRYFHAVRHMMHVFGDVIDPDTQAVALLERDAISYASRVLQTVRIVAGVQRLRLRHFSAALPDTTRVYFRWKTLRSMCVAPAPNAGASEELRPLRAISQGTLGIEGDCAPRDDAEDTEEAPLDLADSENDDDEEDDELLRSYAEDPSHSLHGKQPSSMTPTWRAFEERLRLANARSDGMSVLAYAVYSCAREAAFISRRHKSSFARFASLFPPPALPSASLELLSYLAYDRVGVAVETACREPTVGGATLVPRTTAIPLDMYESSIAGLPKLPHELQVTVEAAHAKVALAAQWRSVSSHRVVAEAALLGDLATATNTVALSDGTSPAAADTADDASIARFIAGLGPNVVSAVAMPSYATATSTDYLSTRPQVMASRSAPVATTLVSSEPVIVRTSTAAAAVEGSAASNRLRSLPKR